MIQRVHTRRNMILSHDFLNFCSNLSVKELQIKPTWKFHSVPKKELEKV